jgi:6-pyruvoyltetrahydropterin/6-carboxytetrahydropterin synthase
MKVYITRKAHFSAAHRLYNPEFSDEENQKLYGLCNNPLYHGHNYVIEVTVYGDIDPKTGYLIDLKKLRDLIEEKIIKYVDHKNLNLEVEFLKGIIPTSENLAVAFWKQLENEIPNGKLYSIKIYESERNIVEFRGEE